MLAVLARLDIDQGRRWGNTLTEAGGAFAAGCRCGLVPDIVPAAAATRLRGSTSASVGTYRSGLIAFGGGPPGIPVSRSA